MPTDSHRRLAADLDATAAAPSGSPASLIVLIGAGVVYAGKAADDRSAFIRWRHQVLEFWHGVNIYDKMMFPNPPIMPHHALPADGPAAGRRGDGLVRAQGRR